jgi:hypothetical protein
MLYSLRPPHAVIPEPIMSLSTQLTRGTLALPMLALFGVLALVAGETVNAESLAPKARATAQATVAVTATAGEAAACGTHARPQLLLAQAPADLGPLAQRQSAGCRA